MPTHVAVWIDHKEARIFAIHPDNIDALVVAAPTHTLHHTHPKGSEEGKHHLEEAKRFFHEVSRAIDGNSEILLVGPGVAKLDFIRYLHTHERAIEAKLIGVETIDHPTDRQFVAYAKAYFVGSIRATAP